MAKTPKEKLFEYYLQINTGGPLLYNWDRIEEMGIDPGDAYAINNELIDDGLLRRVQIKHGYGDSNLYLCQPMPVGEIKVRTE